MQTGPASKLYSLSQICSQIYLGQSQAIESEGSLETPWNLKAW